MAGTRLLLSIVYAIELIALVILAVQYGISKTSSSESFSPKWHPAHQPFIPIRSGVAMLHRYGFDEALKHVREKIGGSGVLMIEVDMRLTFVGGNDNNDDFSPLLRGGILTTLQEEARAFVTRREFDSAPSNSNIQPIISMMDDDLDVDLDVNLNLNLNLCHDESVHKFLQSDSKSSIQVYQTYIAKMGSDDAGCDDHDKAILDVHESGSMMLRIPHQMTDEDIRSIIKSHLWPTFRQLLYYSSEQSSSSQRRLPPSSTSRVILSLVDSNPSSRANAVREKNSDRKVKVKALHHNGILGQVVKEAVEQSLRPMVEKKLSQWNGKGGGDDVDAATSTFVIQSLPYYGTDLSSYAEFTTYKNSPPDHILSIHDAKTLLLHGDLAHLSQGFLSPHGYEDGNHNDDVQLILYVPDGNTIPLYLMNEEGGWAASLTIPDKNLALSVINLPIPYDDMNNKAEGSGGALNATVDEDVNKNRNESEELDILLAQYQVRIADLEEAYRKEVRVGISQLGSFLRRYYGLSPNLQKMSNDINNDDNGEENSELCSLNLLRPDYGIAQWEMDHLIREHIVRKARGAVETLERVYELIHLREGMSVTVRSAEKMIHCANVLQEAVDMLATVNDYHDDHKLYKANTLLSQAAQLAYIVSKDEDMIEVPYFALDQLFAVFGSLLLPLIVPMLKNLKIEIKRYKEKTKSKTEVHSKDEKEDNTEKVKDE